VVLSSMSGCTALTPAPDYWLTVAASRENHVHSPSSQCNMPGANFYRGRLPGIIDE